MYNKHTGGCDNNDQMTRFHRARCHYKWPRRLFVKNIMWAVYNSFIVYSILSGTKGCFMDHLEKLCYSLIGEFRSKHSRKRRLSLDSERRLMNVGLHFPELPDGGYDHRCIVCTKKESAFKKANPGLPNPFKRSKTSTRCSECEAYLCMKKGATCWRDWHTKKEFWR